jgi:predicted tellurium resistance membrane protein TerC
MGKILSTALLLGIIGLVVGYFLFGKVGNSYIGLKALLMPSDSLLSQIGNTLRGVETIRQNILLSGGAGAVVGAVTGALRSR